MSVSKSTRRGQCRSAHMQVGRAIASFAWFIEIILHSSPIAPCLECGGPSCNARRPHGERTVQLEPTLRACLGVGLCFASVPNVAGQSNADLVGYTDLVDRLGTAAPDGAAIVVGQVEVGRSGPGPAGAYAPDPLHPQFAGKTFLLQ